jgi:type II secretory pathway pseudopilin PulG
MLKPKSFLNPFKIIRSRSGFGIIEVMVAAGLLLIISVGITTLLTNMQKEQRRQALLQTLTQLQSRFESAIKNQTSWNNTIADATNLSSTSCLNAKSACAAGNVDSSSTNIFVNNSSRDLILKDTTNAVLYDGRQTTNTSGFKEDGSACTGFSYNSAAGNDACPIGYIVNWRAMTSDKNSQLVVSAKLIFNPSNANSFKQFINATTVSTIYGKYDVKVLRTAAFLAKSFSIKIMKSSLSSGNCSTGGFGSCASGGTDLFSAGVRTYTSLDDPYSLVLSTTATGELVLAAGRYKCTATSSAFGTDTSVLTIVSSTSGSIATGSAFASSVNYGYANISAIGEVTMTGADNIKLRQSCATTPAVYAGTTDPSLAQCALGFSNTTYTPASSGIVATLDCVLL